MGDKYSVPSNQTSQEEHLIEISNTVLHKLASGTTSGEALKTTNENFWIDKLADIDTDHSKRTGLDVKEAERILNDINAYINTKSQRSCPLDVLKVIDCLEGNIGNTLACDSDVEKFKRCVDKSLHDAVRKNIKSVSNSKTI